MIYYCVLNSEIHLSILLLIFQVFWETPQEFLSRLPRKSTSTSGSSVYPTPQILSIISKPSLENKYLGVKFRTHLVTLLHLIYK